MKKKTHIRKKTALYTAFIYFTVSVLWIIVTDNIVLALTNDHKLITKFQTYKGWIFITSSSVLIFFLINKFEKGIKNSITHLQKANNDLKLFFYKTSHDLRGPVVSSLGLINIARDEITDQKALDYLQKLNEQTCKTDNILKDLTVLTRIMEDDLHINKIKIKFLITDILQHLSYLDGYKNTRFTTDISEIKAFYSDENIIRKVLENIIENAIIYQSYRSNKPSVSIYIKSCEKQIKIDIQDNGIGIDPELQSQVFEMFFRGSSISNGSGLGLYLAKTGVTKLNGDIKIKSSTGKGTCFSIILPNLHKHKPVKSLFKETQIND